MHFIGIDLAWKISDNPKPRTGLAAIDGDGFLIDVGVGASDNDILNFVHTHLDESCAIGIDAPLVVPNETGLRPVERALHRQGIHAYPANRSLFTRVYEGVRGEELVEKLSGDGFRLATGYEPDTNETGSQEARGRLINRLTFEVFPSPAYRKLLHLPSSVKFKRRKGVSTADIQYGLGEARDGLVSGMLSPPLVVDDSILSRPIATQNIRALRGSALDQFGDILDAILCAYIIYRYYLDPESTRVVGDLETGYIIVP